MAKLSSEYAAIAQSVERILGKDEVASSNLASSSKKEPTPPGVGSFFTLLPFELAKPVRIWPPGAAPPVADTAAPEVVQRSVCNAVACRQGAHRAPQTG